MKPARTRMWRGVTLQLFLFAVLPLTILVLGVTFGSLSLHHEAMRSLVADRNFRSAQSAAASITQEINHRGKTLELVSKELDLSSPVEPQLRRIEEDLAIFDGGLVTVDASGKPGTSIGGHAILRLAEMPDWQQLLTQIQTSTSGTANYLPVQTLDGQDFLPVGVDLGNGMTLVGLFSPETLLSAGLAVVSRGETVTILVVDKRYQVLFKNGELAAGEDLPTHPGIQDALTGTGGIQYYPTSQGEHVITTSVIQPVNWALMIEESWEDIASPLLQVTQYAPLMILPVLGLSLLALWFGLRQIVQPMQALEIKARDLAQGDFESIRKPVGGVPEIGHLQQSLINMAAQLKEAQNSLHSYIGAITDSVENERRSLARELHDDTLQVLIALGQYTQYALHWNKDPRVEKTLNQVMDLSEKGMKNLRRMVQGLRPIYIEDLGLAAALAMQASQSNGKGGAAIHFQQEGDERRLKPEVELALYRMAQEAISNVHRHSSALNAWINLAFMPKEISLEIRDDGQGFHPVSDPIQYAKTGHYGLLGLYERSELLGARLTISSGSGEGTRVLVRLADKESPGIDTSESDKPKYLHKWG